MPISTMLSGKLVSVGTSLFMVLGSGHYDLDQATQEADIAVPATTQITSAMPVDSVPSSTTTSTKPAESATSAYAENKQIDAFTLTAATISVSCIKLEWSGDADTEYTVTAIQNVNDDYVDNIYFEFKSNTLCYVTGLRENSEYTFELSDENGEILASAVQKTEAVEVIEEFDYIDGWTNCFAYERASGLTRDPSYSAIQGAVPDPVTNTGIMRDEYGDYCCAMGTFFGYCGDRFLITLENGTQFTVKICDSKGDRWYHPFGGDGKCIVEFIHADGYLPDCVSFTGNYGSYNWYGLNFDNIQSIKKINYGTPIKY